MDTDSLDKVITSIIKVKKTFSLTNNYLCETEHKLVQEYDIHLLILFYWCLGGREFGITKYDSSKKQLKHKSHNYKKWHTCMLCSKYE